MERVCTASSIEARFSLACTHPLSAVLSRIPTRACTEVRAVETFFTRPPVFTGFQFTVVEGPATKWPQEPHGAFAPRPLAGVRAE